MSLVEVNQAILAWSFLICENKTVFTQYTKFTKLPTCKVCQQNYDNFCVFTYCSKYFIQFTCSGLLL